MFFFFFFSTMKIVIHCILACITVKIPFKMYKNHYCHHLQCYLFTDHFLLIVVSHFFLSVLSSSCDQNTDVLETAGCVKEAAVSVPWS